MLISNIYATPAFLQKGIAASSNPGRQDRGLFLCHVLVRLAPKQIRDRPAAHFSDRHWRPGKLGYNFRLDRHATNTQQQEH
ncbi:hypothetical protein [Collimonas fungivorans]|uniref:hypothetical protein n=1 Tax=Collimonas fungivorans TaxID=158899 RepID=UPI0026EC0358|nr:hypothetical protein [Collimonas fungivorans]